MVISAVISAVISQKRSSWPLHPRCTLRWGLGRGRAGGQAARASGDRGDKRAPWTAGEAAETAEEAAEREEAQRHGGEEGGAARAAGARRISQQWVGVRAGARSLMARGGPNRRSERAEERAENDRSAMCSQTGARPTRVGDSEHADGERRKETKNQTNPRSEDMTHEPRVAAKKGRWVLPRR